MNTSLYIDSMGGLRDYMIAARITEARKLFKDGAIVEARDLLQEISCAIDTWMAMLENGMVQP